MSQLRDVLNRFDQQNEPTSIRQMAQDMNIEQGVLMGMIDYWVRKGKLRAVNSVGADCSHCGVKSACPFITPLPVYYERVTDEDKPQPPTTCNCGTGGCH